MEDYENLDSYMAKADDIPEDEDVIVKDEDTVDDDVVKDDKEGEVDITDVPDSEGKKEESGEDVVKRIMKDVGTRKKEPDDVEDKDNTSLSAFTKVALAQGWEQDDITKFTEGLDDDTLLALIPELMDTDEESEDADSEETHKSEKEAEGKPKSTDGDSKDSDTKAEIEALKKEIENLKKGKEEEAKKDAEAQVAQIMATADKMFDDAAEKFEIFGKTNELLKYPAGPKKGQYVLGQPAMVARDEVWKKALPFIKTGASVEEAMDIAITWYKGKELEKDVHRNIIKDLKKNEQKLSAKRSSKKTTKVYKSEDERKDAVVREAARRAGVKGHFGD